MRYNDGIHKYVPLWGEWEVEDVVGSGSFGKVYKVYKMLGNEKVISAAKYMTIPNREQYEEAMLSIGNNHSTMRSYFREITAKVENEIKLLYKLRGNSNIVSYEDYTIKERDDIGWDIIIKMEYVQPFDKYIQFNNITQKDILNLAIDICTGLKLCHDTGIIHRDIKDSNIFVSENGSYKIGDFGIATDISSQGEAMTRVGTPYYMAPEINFNQGNGCYDKTVDIYSLGIVLYRLFNKLRFPFMPNYPQPITFTNKEEARAKRFKGEPMPKPVDASDDIWNIIKKACEHKPKDRYQNVEDLKNDLVNILKSMNESELNKVIVKSSAEKPLVNDSDETVLINEENNSTILIDGYKEEGSNKDRKISISNKKIIKMASIILAMGLSGSVVLGISNKNILTFNSQKPILPKVDKIEYNSNQITGIAQSGNEISILIDGEKIASGIVSEDGSFKIEIPRYQVGTQIDIIATNDKGYMSETVTMMVIKDKVTTIEDIYENSEYICGISEADNRISVIKDGIEIASSVVESDGTFKVKIEPQISGTNLDIVSKYKDGTVSEKLVVKVKEEQKFEISDNLGNDTISYINEIEKVIDEIQNLIDMKDEKGRPLYKVDKEGFAQMKNNFEKFKNGENVSVEDILIEVEVKEIKYGASS